MPLRSEEILPSGAADQAVAAGRRDDLMTS
jgi:hypothetical protein